MKTLAEITIIDVTRITKVNAHVNTSGWGNRYLIVKTLFYSALYVKSTVTVYNAYHDHIISNVLIFLNTFWLFKLSCSIISIICHVYDKINITHFFINKT